jgi:hypothetical protein
MARLNQVEIRCQHCHRWFPSPVVFGDDESFDTATLVEDTVTCPHCARLTGCDDANVRIRTEDSGENQ